MRGREVGREMASGVSRNLLLALLLFLALPGGIPAAGEGAPPAAPPHAHFRDPAGCGRCHVFRESNLDPDRFAPGIDAFCLGCHSLEELGVTHPRNGIPEDDPGRMAVPIDFPLDIEGRIFCLTCHRAHGAFLSPTRSYPSQKPELAGAPAGTGPAFRTYFARRSDPVRGFATLCEACHGKR